MGDIRESSFSLPSLSRGLTRKESCPRSSADQGKRRGLKSCGGLCLSKCRKRRCKSEPGLWGQTGTWLGRRQRAWLGMDIPGRARSHRGCIGWAQYRSPRGTTAAPRSRWPSRSRWHPAGRGQALGSRRRVAPPRTHHSEETERKETSQS